VPGALGTLLFVIARNISVDVPSRAWPPDWAFTVDRFVRYGYLLWLTVYFLIAGVENKQSVNANQPRSCDIAYDAVTYVCAFSAAVFMGFIVPDIHTNVEGTSRQMWPSLSSPVSRCGCSTRGLIKASTCCGVPASF
jgi:hypothetical protein